MRKHFYPCLEKLHRYRYGPFSEHITGYADLLSQQGYSDYCSWTKIRLVGEFGCWLDRKHVRIVMLDEHQVDVFLRTWLSKKRFRKGERATLTLLLKHLRRKAVIPARLEKTCQSPADLIEQDYRRYLLDERNLVWGTVEGYIAIVRRFLSHIFPEGNVELDKLCPECIAKFVLHDSNSRGRRACQLATTALRSLLRFLFQKGELPTNLAPSVPTVAGWRLSELPHYLEPAQVEKVLKCCDRDRKVGKRNYAILLLLARLGLRAGEVAQLSLEDIDWGAGELRIQGKGGRIDRLPLPQSVGEAIADYLLKARPDCSSRRVFVYIRAPHKGFTCPPNGICCLVRRALERAQLNPPHKGAHVLRHSLATEMLGNGASLTQIGRVLRHRQIQTTEIYAKVNLDALRKLAQPWPGGVQ